MSNTKAYSAISKTSPLAPATITRRDPGPTDVQIQILFCGVCHTDLHISRDEWGGTTYPCVPGHEIVGRVIKVGAQVKNFKEGDLAAVLFRHHHIEEHHVRPEIARGEPGFLARIDLLHVEISSPLERKLHQASKTCFVVDQQNPLLGLVHIKENVTARSFAGLET